MFFDTETTGLDAWHSDRPFIFAFCDDEGVSVAYVLDVDPFTRKPIDDTYIARSKLAEVYGVLENEDEHAETVIMHNAKFDVRMMEIAHGIAINRKIEDTMYMAHACKSNEAVGLKPLAKKYLDFPDDDEKELQAAVLKARRIVKKLKLGWQLGFSKHYRPDGTVTIKAETKTDYWLPRAIAKDKKASAVLTPAERKRWKHLAAIYAKKDVERTWMLYHLFNEILDKEPGARAAYDMEMALWPVTYAMESRGVLLKVDELDRLTAATQVERAKNLLKVQKKAWQGFNPESNADLIRLCKKLKFSFEDFTPTGQPKVDKYLFLGLINHSTIRSLLRFKSQNQALTSFLLKFKAFADKDMIIHPDFRQVGPRTRRLSCADPNLQNTTDDTSARAFEPAQVRACFGPRPGYVWLLADYSQLEVIIFADGSQEPVMLRALAAGEDVHATIANEAWGKRDNPRAVQAAIELLELNRERFSSDAVGDAVGGLMDGNRSNPFNASHPFKTVTDLPTSFKHILAETWLRRFDYDIIAAEQSIGKKAMRGRAKALVFLKIFGGGVRAAKRNLQTTAEAAQQFLDDFSERMPGIDTYLYDMTQLVRRQGYILNAYDIRISVDKREAYKGVNYYVQGSAASHLKCAMIECQKYIDEIGLDIHMLMSVHDEIVFEVLRKHARRGVIETLRDIMQQPRPERPAFGIPTPVNIERTTTNWAEKKKVKWM